MICIQPFHSSVWSRCSGFAAAASPESRSVSSPITSSSPYASAIPCCADVNSCIFSSVTDTR